MNAYDTLARISAPIPAALISQKVVDKKGSTVSFVKWFDLCDLFDERAPGWCSDLRIIEGPAPSVICRVTVPTDDGPIWREATGTDDELESNYGSPLDRAEASALRRVFAKFGLGRELYGGKGAPARQAKHARATAAAMVPASEGERAETAAWFVASLDRVNTHDGLAKLDERLASAPKAVRTAAAVSRARERAVARLAAQWAAGEESNTVDLPGAPNGVKVAAGSH